jgi:hypothetical protein
MESIREHWGAGFEKFWKECAPFGENGTDEYHLCQVVCQHPIKPNKTQRDTTGLAGWQKTQLPLGESICKRPGKKGRYRKKRDVKKG